MKRSPLYVIGRTLLMPIFKLLFFYKINGKENVPDDGPYIICSNHLSNCDPVFLAITQKRQIYYMAKIELFKNPVMGWLYRHLGAFPVQRGAGDGKAINEAENIVRDGKLLGIFIEGTRSKTGELGRAHAGAILIAHQTNTPITPCCITPRTGFFTPFKKTKVMFGEPITCEELGVKEGTNREYREAAKKVMEIIADMRKKHREEFDGKKRKQKKEE